MSLLFGCLWSSGCDCEGNNSQTFGPPHMMAPLGRFHISPQPAASHKRWWSTFHWFLTPTHSAIQRREPWSGTGDPNPIFAFHTSFSLFCILSSLTLLPPGSSANTIYTGICVPTNIFRVSLKHDELSIQLEVYSSHGLSWCSITTLSKRSFLLSI